VPTGGAWAAVPAPKIGVPALPLGLISRDLLTTDLLRAAEAEVTLVCAPAGYGKTTLLSGWADGRNAAGREAVGWLGLDAYDNDPFRLWSGVLSALQPIDGIGDRLDRLSPPREGVDPGFLAAFIDAIDDVPAGTEAAPVWLLLDDAHHIHDSAAVAGLNMLIERLPQRMRLVVACRADPPLPALRKLRLAGRLSEIRARPLAFSRDEAANLLATHHVHLPDPVLDLLVDRTEGWPAALRLAGISLAGRSDPGAAVARFLSNDANLADYLFGEALARQPDHIRRFMLSTSVCRQFTEDLAEILSGQAAADILDQLQRDNALIVRTGPDGQWYRYHSLFRSYALTYLRRQHALAPLHAKAAAWFAAQGDVETALEHAVVAEDAEVTNELMEKHGLHLVLSGRARLLRRLLATPAATSTDRPQVVMIAAAAALDGNDFAAADDFLARLEATPAERLDEWQRLLHAALRVQRAVSGGDLASAMAGLAAVYRDDCGDADLDLLALTWRGTAEFTLGDSTAAEADLRRGAELARRLGNDYIQLSCLSKLASTLSVQSQFVAMGEVAAAAIELANARGWAASPRCAAAYAVAAWSAYSRVDREAAARLAPLAMEAVRSNADPVTDLSVRCVDAAIRFDSADRHAALQEWQAIWAKVDDRHVPPNIAAFGALVQVRLALAAGEHHLATGAVDRIRGMPGLTAEVNLLQAQIHADRGHTGPARRLLRPITSGELTHVIIPTCIDAWLLEAVLAAANGETVGSRRAVDKALALAVPRWALREFVAAGQPLRTLLIRDIGRFGPHEDFVAAAIAAIGPPDEPAPESLTHREVELLAELPSMRTVDQLAETLFISPSTVKTHLRSIYSKLGVSTRRDAVAVGRSRGLI
jgi:LuxR family maltose regulon positive regulatory protein